MLVYLLSPLQIAKQTVYDLVLGRILDLRKERNAISHALRRNDSDVSIEKDLHSRLSDLLLKYKEDTNEVGKKNPGFIHGLMFHGPGDVSMVLAHEESLRLAVSLSKSPDCVMCTDATGGVIKRGMEVRNRNYFIYPVLFRAPLKSGKWQSVVVADIVTSHHSASFLKLYYDFVLGMLEGLNGNNPIKLSAAVCDGSLAMKAVCNHFANGHSNRQALRITSDLLYNRLDVSDCDALTAVVGCSAHLAQMETKYLKTKTTISPTARKLFIRAVMAVLQTTDRAVLEELLEDLIRLMTYQWMDNVGKTYYEKLLTMLNIINPVDFDENVGQLIVVDHTEPDVIFDWDNVKPVITDVKRTFAQNNEFYQVNDIQ